MLVIHCPSMLRCSWPASPRCLTSLTATNHCCGRSLRLVGTCCSAAIPCRHISVHGRGTLKQNSRNWMVCGVDWRRSFVSRRSDLRLWILLPRNVRLFCLPHLSRLHERFLSAFFFILLRYVVISYMYLLLSMNTRKFATSDFVCVCVCSLLPSSRRKCFHICWLIGWLVCLLSVNKITQKVMDEILGR